jgi:chromosome segregation ATPase
VIGGKAVETSDANVRDLSQLCDEFKFMDLAKAVRDWQAEHQQVDPVIRRELDLVWAALAERLESQGREMLMVDQALHARREAAINDAEKLSAMEVEVSGLRSLLGETVASVQKAAGDVDRVRAAAAQQRMAHGRDICALEEEMGRVREMVARQGDDLAGTGRGNSELGGRVQRLKEESRVLRESSEGLKGELARAEAGRQSEVACLQGAITSGGSKVKEDLSNAQGVWRR